MSPENMRIGLILFPDLTQLDLTGPAEVFGRMPGAEVFFLWKTLEPVRSDKGLTILPTARFEDCAGLDVICVPGGPGRSSSWMTKRRSNFSAAPRLAAGS